MGIIFLILGALAIYFIVMIWREEDRRQKEIEEIMRPIIEKAFGSVEAYEAIKINVYNTPLRLHEYNYSSVDNDICDYDNSDVEEQFSGLNELQYQQMLSQEEMNRQDQQWFMDELEKSVTPFEMGGYDMEQGNSFNDHNMF